MLVDNNEITAFNHGCSDEEFANRGKYIIIRNNKFNNITGYVFDFLKATSSNHGGGLQIYDTRIESLNTVMFSGNYLDNVMISNNVVESVNRVAAKLINAVQSKNVIITGNMLPADVTYDTPVISTNTTNLIDASNSWN